MRNKPANARIATSQKNKETIKLKTSVEALGNLPMSSIREIEQLKIPTKNAPTQMMSKTLNLNLHSVCCARTYKATNIPITASNKAENERLASSII